MIASLLAAALSLSNAAEPPRPAGVDYQLAPVVEAGRLTAVDVTVRFAGDADGSTDIDLPNEWAGSSNLFESIGDLRVDGGRLIAASEPETRRIDHAASAALTVRYRVTGAQSADPGPQYEKARPVIRPTWFYLHGEGVIATPRDRAAAPATFRWASPAPGWRFAGSLDAAEVITVDGVAQAIFIGGTDLRIATSTVGGRPVTTVLRGEWPFSDAVFADALGKVVAASNAYWQAPAVPFFVPLIPLTGGETGAISYGGTGRTGGFALSSTGNVGLPDIIRLLAHEYGHRWFGRSLGPVSEPDSREYWFTEGFNDFVADAVLVRAGLRDSAAQAAALNTLLLRYASSPARTTAYAGLTETFWQDNDAQQMIYDRGHLLALSLDGEASVHAALAKMATGPASFATGATEAQRFLAAYPSLSAARLGKTLAGEPVTLGADLLQPCGTIQWQEQPRYATGYTSEEKDGVRRFVTVDQASPAWAAGLRPGMLYVRRISFLPGDARVPMVMRVADDAGERTLSWLPRGAEMVRFQALQLRPEAGPACSARLSGR